MVIWILAWNMDKWDNVYDKKHVFLIPHHCIFCEAGSRKAIHVFLTATLNIKVWRIEDC